MLSIFLDCGAGIGRITKNLLLPLFDVVDMVEQNAGFLEKAREYLVSITIGMLRAYYPTLGIYFGQFFSFPLEKVSKPLHVAFTSNEEHCLLPVISVIKPVCYSGTFEHM